LLTVAEVVLQMKAAGKEIEIQEDVLANIGESVQSESRSVEDGEHLFFNLAAAQEEEEENE
jgi:hypothetical protein